MSSTTDTWNASSNENVTFRTMDTKQLIILAKHAVECKTRVAARSELARRKLVAPTRPNSTELVVAMLRKSMSPPSK